MHIFKPGDLVMFKGLTISTTILAPSKGLLKLADRNTTHKGVMTIKGNHQRLLFNPEGTIYCHEYLGVLLEPVETAENDYSDSLDKSTDIKKGE